MTSSSKPSNTGRSFSTAGGRSGIATAEEGKLTLKRELTNKADRDEDPSEDYFVVDRKKGEMRDGSLTIPAQTLSMVKTAMRAAASGRKPLRVWLWYAATQTSSANTALAYAQRLRPSDSLEFASLANLYDEYKAERVHVIYHAAVTGAALTTNVDFAAAYDPSNNGSYTSIVAVLPARYHVVHNLSYDMGVVGGGAPKCVTPDGVWHHRFPIPKGGIVNPTAVNNVNTGNWTDTSVTDVDYGYWKGYATAGGTSCVVNVAHKIGIEVVFKMRS